jgi:hypothetical protein
MTPDTELKSGETCNAEYSESGNHDKHTHHCVHNHDHAEVDTLECAHAWHNCACGKEWSDE